MIFVSSFASTAAAGTAPPPPEVILPSQYFDATRADLSPVQRLLLAILEDAIECAMDRGGARRVNRLRCDALYWMFGPDTSAPFSFADVCDALNIDPDYFRAGLTRWLRAARAGRTPAHVPYHQNTRRHDVMTPKRCRSGHTEKNLSGMAVGSQRPARGRGAKA